MADWRELFEACEATAAARWPGRSVAVSLTHFSTNHGVATCCIQRGGDTTGGRHADIVASLYISEGRTKEELLLNLLGAIEADGFQVAELEEAVTS